jgi:hypothetical protein
MTIAQALKEKNKKVATLQKLWERMQKYNSIQEGAERPYSTAEIFAQIGEVSADLILLKTRIHSASELVRSDIFALSEFKNIAQRIKGIDCTTGTQVERYSSTTFQKTAELSITWQDRELAAIEDKIESIQERLDKFNHTTEI